MKPEPEANNPQRESALPSATLLGVALPILQGLLASGHYTMPADENEPDVFRVDNGKDWKEIDEIPVFAKRYSAKAVLDAIELANELRRQIEIDANADALKDT